MNDALKNLLAGCASEYDKLNCFEKALTELYGEVVEAQLFYGIDYAQFKTMDELRTAVSEVKKACDKW